jgi:hypothetical protein
MQIKNFAQYVLEILSSNRGNNLPYYKVALNDFNFRSILAFYPANLGECVFLGKAALDWRYAFTLPLRNKTA